MKNSKFTILIYWNTWLFLTLSVVKYSMYWVLEVRFCNVTLFADVSTVKIVSLSLAGPYDNLNNKSLWSISIPSYKSLSFSHVLTFALAKYMKSIIIWYSCIPVFVIIFRVANGWWCPRNLNVICTNLCGNFMWWAWTTMNELTIPIRSETRNIQWF